jgi:tetraacyldisaccharide 4'-kinase
MPDSLLEFGRDAITGRSRGPAAVLFRTAAAVVEPFYSAVTTARNIAYDRGWFATFDLGRPTVSVGNVTTGGTGKTPVVRWLAERFRSAGHRPAVLMRGYAADPAGESDERLLLDRGLNSDPSVPPVPVMANPSRVEGAAAVLAADAGVDRFILDDGFQHRRARRSFDLVLVNATDPFGGGRVLPRGLLREPLRGVRRADALLITRSSMVDAAALQAIERRLHRLAPELPVFRSDHVPFVAGAATSGIESLQGISVIAVSGIGDPESFERQLTSAGCFVGHQVRSPDHHRYTPSDIAEIARLARNKFIATTEKDWVKIEPLLNDEDRRRWVVLGVAIRFAGDDEELLLERVSRAARRD